MKCLRALAAGAKGVLETPGVTGSPAPSSDGGVRLRPAWRARGASRRGGGRPRGRYLCGGWKPRTEVGGCLRTEAGGSGRRLGQTLEGRPGEGSREHGDGASRRLTSVSGRQAAKAGSTARRCRRSSGPIDRFGGRTERLALTSEPDQARAGALRSDGLVRERQGEESRRFDTSVSGAGAREDASPPSGPRSWREPGRPARGRTGAARAAGRGGIRPATVEEMVRRLLGHCRPSATEKGMEVETLSLRRAWHIERERLEGPPGDR